MRVRWVRQLMLAAALSIAPVAVWAQSPVAIVEDIDSPTAGVEFMDYLFAGQIVRLARDGKMVVSYLTSCWREKIAAGTVTVGREQSDVRDGVVERTRFACHGGKMRLVDEQAKQSGGMTFRAPARKGTAAKAPDVETVILYGSSPMIELGGPGKLTIERVDKPEAAIEQDVAAQQLIRGAYLDLAKAGTSLTRGGTYRIKHKGREAVIRIADDAEPGATAIAARLVRLPKS
jgi:hypothetical protein